MSMSPVDSPKDDPQEAKRQQAGIPLPALVSLGLFASLAVLVLLGWYFAEQEYLRQCAPTCPAWILFPPLSAEGMFSVIRNTVTAAAALGLGVTIVLSYRRQRVAEQTLTYTAETQRLAVKAQTMESKRMDRETLDTLRKRYLDIATLLNTKGDLNRITALHALESLTISWRQFENIREASASLGLLLSTARLANSDRTTQGQEFRKTITRTLDRHMRLDAEDNEAWGCLTVDATACVGTAIEDWIVDGGTVTASPRREGSFAVNTMTIRSGTVRLEDNYPPSAGSVAESTLKKLVLEGGRLEVALKHSTYPLSATFSNCSMNGGRIVFYGRTHNDAARDYHFRECEFRGARMWATEDRSVSFHFEDCTFSKNPFGKFVLNSKNFRAEFINCVSEIRPGERKPVTSIEDLIALKRKPKTVEVDA
ncbi:hypothetical protein QNO00_08465 [Arthrobacter sp. zg-Y1219]|uniref:hypothetical protein n=1 Tax=Arthrobacter sp. zg-Y1219 TaxID=3049067 RepID=UPI0024C418A3|nr:hypothetical protein [Arthrobacter sp. zg-Y1219]MDK1360297.1 hypothetical protein [Arthrobacter sp. zg-Y1219]